MLKLRQIFLGTLFFALVVQGYLWKNTDLVDRDLWVAHTEHVLAWDSEIFDKRIYGHPGAPIMVFAMAAHLIFGLPLSIAFPGSMALLNSIFIAGATVVCKALRPNSMWWLATGLLLVFNRLYTTSTPPTAVVSPLLVFIILLCLLVFENAPSIKKILLVILGILFGLAAATRFDISVAIAFASLFILLPRMRWSQAGIVVGCAVTVFWIVNPFMWHIPIQHVTDLVGVMLYHYNDYPASSVPLIVLLLISPIAIASLGFALVSVFNRRLIPQAPSASFMTWLLLTTAAIVGVLLNSQFQAQRYFFPLVFIWEAFLPVFLLSAISSFQFDFLQTSLQQKKLRRIAQLTILTLVIAGQAAMFVHILTMPDIIIVCGPTSPNWLEPLCDKHMAVILW